MSMHERLLEPKAAGETDRYRLAANGQKQSFIPIQLHERSIHRTDASIYRKPEN